MSDVVTVWLVDEYKYSAHCDSRVYASKESAQAAAEESRKAAGYYFDFEYLVREMTVLP